MTQNASQAKSGLFSALPRRQSLLPISATGQRFFQLFVTFIQASYVPKVHLIARLLGDKKQKGYQIVVGRGVGACERSVPDSEGASGLSLAAGVVPDKIVQLGCLAGCQRPKPETAMSQVRRIGCTCFNRFQIPNHFNRYPVQIKRPSGQEKV